MDICLESHCYITDFHSLALSVLLVALIILELVEVVVVLCNYLYSN